MQIVRLSETDAEVAEFVERWRRSRADIVNIKELDTWGGQIDEVSGLAVDGDEAAAAVAAGAQDGSVDGVRLPCPNLWYHCHIHWDGVLVSCSRDYDAVTPLGNVRNGGVLKTWHGARMRQMREWHAGKNFCATQCQQCTEWSWWRPTPFGGGGTGGKVDRVAGDRGGGIAMAVAIRDQREPAAAGPAEAAFRVIWLGERPWWLDDPAARTELDGIEPGPPVSGRTRPLVVHARASVLHTLRRASHERLVADISGSERLDRMAARVARAAEVVLVDDPGRLRALHGAPSSTWSLLRTPLDLEEYAPERVLHERRDAALKRFRRLHRLSPRTLLYAGPYRPEGGLHVMLELAEKLRERYDDLVVAAIPEGPVDARYRDACERRALALGHRALIEWEVSDEDRPLWYALAAAVCIPATGSVPVAPVLRAAAAGVPLVATAVESLSELAPGFTGPLVPVGDVREFAARIELLLDQPGRAQAAGDEVRRLAEKQLSPAAAARALRTLWSGLAPPG